jgi:hypothetical protein
MAAQLAASQEGLSSVRIVVGKIRRKETTRKTKTYVGRQY